MRMHHLSPAVMLPAVIAATALFAFAACDRPAKEAADTQEAMIGTAETSGMIVPEGAVLTNHPLGVVFDTAGSPCWDGGRLFFTNNNFEPVSASRTYLMEPDGTVRIIRDGNNATTAVKRSGHGTFYCCEMRGHRVIEMDADGQVMKVVSGEYNGKRVDGPNDLIVDSRGGIYYTDSQFIGDEAKMQDTTAVYYVTPDGSTKRVLDDIEFPNGIAISPDGRTLYVTNSYGRFLRAYDILADATVSNGRDFAELQVPAEANGQSGADGLAVDSAGNIFVATTKGVGIQVVSPAGKIIGTIPAEVVVNNVAFGGEDLKTLYVSAKDGIYTIPVLVPGLPIPVPAW